MDKKVTVVGAGNVGATAAQRLAEKELCDVVLVDIIEPHLQSIDLGEEIQILVRAKYQNGKSLIDPVAKAHINSKRSFAMLRPVSVFIQSTNWVAIDKIPLNNNNDNHFKFFFK